MAEENENHQQCCDHLLLLIPILILLPAASHAPYKWDYWPHDDVRAECRFVGLTNLGATCYLASTIQQLYMIPEARQAVFTAKVSTCSFSVSLKHLSDSEQRVESHPVYVCVCVQYAEDIKHKTTLLELQKMFTYLMVSSLVHLSFYLQPLPLCILTTQTHN